MEILVEWQAAYNDPRVKEDNRDRELAASDELSLGFEGGRVVHVSLRRLGLPARPRFVFAARVAARLKAFREGSGATQREMARRLDMAPPNYNRLEAGRHRPTADTLLHIAEVMGISLGRLVQG